MLRGPKRAFPAGGTGATRRLAPGDISLRRGSLFLFLGLLTLASTSCARPALYRPPPGGSILLTAPEDTGEPAEARLPSLTVITFEDARPEEHKVQLSVWLEEQGGHTGEAMTRDRMYRRGMGEMAGDAVAEALSSSGHFERVERAREVAAASTEWVLTARIRRLRGWQAYRVEKDQPARLLESMGDVFIDDIEIIEVASGRLLFVGQTGAMLEDLPEEVDPYAIAQLAFDAAARALVAMPAEIDPGSSLYREVSIQPGAEGGVDDLQHDLPPGWTGAFADPDSPRGWSGEPSCARLRAEDATRWFFHPRLGFYRPSLELWWCPEDWEGRMSFEGEGSRYPAAHLGNLPSGESVFFFSLGKSSWSTAREDLAAYLELEVRDESVLAVPVEPAPRRIPTGPASGMTEEPSRGLEAK